MKIHTHCLIIINANTNSINGFTSPYLFLIPYSLFDFILFCIFHKKKKKKFFWSAGITVSYKINVFSWRNSFHTLSLQNLLLDIRDDVLTVTENFFLIHFECGKRREKNFNTRNKDVYIKFIYIKIFYVLNISYEYMMKKIVECHTSDKLEGFYFINTSKIKVFFIPLRQFARANRINSQKTTYVGFVFIPNTHIYPHHHRLLLANRNKWIEWVNKKTLTIYLYFFFVIKEWANRRKDFT